MNNLKNQDSINSKYFIEEKTGFEGTEKRIEIEVSPSSEEGTDLRSVNQKNWSEMLEIAKCQILSKTSNEYFDSYILSESSLFVFPRKLVLKTCGTTTILLCLPYLLSLLQELGMKVDFFFFRHKNFTWPELQLWPHGDFQEEIKFLDQHFKNGKGQVIGALKNDRWYVYIEDNREKEKLTEEVTFEVLMHGLDQKVMSQFFKKEDVSVEETTKTSGIEDLLSGATIDAFQFEPCGYSMNSLLDNIFSTIHITPEDHCSYVSFESNISHQVLEKHNKSYTDIVNQIIDTFKPTRASVSFFADSNSLKDVKVDEMKRKDIEFTVLGYDISTNQSKEYQVSFNDHFELVENLEID